MSPEEIESRMDGTLADLGNGRIEAWLPSPAIQNHAAFLAWLPNGRLACAWFGGTLEGKSDISIHISTLQMDRARWSDAVRVTDDPARSEQNPVLWINDGEVALFHTSQVSGNQEGSEIRMRRLSFDGGRIDASDPETVRLPAGTFVRASVVRRKDGALLLPVFLCKARPGTKWNGSHDTAAVAVSEDGGSDWRLVHVPQSLGCVHMTIVPLGGDRMVALFRRRQADFVYRTSSEDGGETWSAPETTDVPNNNSSINAIRLADGRIALICNPASAATSNDRRVSLYDELGEKDGRPDSDGGIEPVWGVPRAPMTLCFSSDEGRTFPDRRLIEDGPGSCLSNNSVDGRNEELSYPVLVEDGEGTLHLAYTYHRRAIKYVRLTRNWIASQQLECG